MRKKNLGTGTTELLSENLGLGRNAPKRIMSNVTFWIYEKNLGTGTAEPLSENPALGRNTPWFGGKLADFRLAHFGHFGQCFEEFAKTSMTWKELPSGSKTALQPQISWRQRYGVRCAFESPADIMPDLLRPINLYTIVSPCVPRDPRVRNLDQ